MNGLPLVSPLVRPLVSPLAGAASGADRDAAAYAKDVASYGPTVTGAQRTALSVFAKAEKAAGRWPLIKRLYLPVWGQPDANASCLVSRIPGSYLGGGFTHGAGFASGNGTTSFFDTGVGPATLGLTVGSGGFGWLSPGGGTDAANSLGAATATQYVTAQWFAGTGVRSIYNDLGVGLVAAGASALAQNHAIISMQRHGGLRYIRRRVTAGVTSLASVVGADSGGVPNTNLWMFAFNNNGVYNGGSNINYGAFWVNLGWSAADSDGFTANLKILWESLTGLTLP